MVQLVEKHIISKTHYLFKEADHLCFLSKNLFNYANYMIRQQFFATGVYLNYYSIQKRCQGTPDYIALPAKVAQQVLLRLHESWQSFLATNQEYKKHPEKFPARPQIPNYKHKILGRNVVTYTAQAVSKTALKRGLIHNHENSNRSHNSCQRYLSGKNYSSLVTLQNRNHLLSTGNHCKS